MKNATKSWRHRDIDEVMFRRRRFKNAKIGIGLCAFYACEYRTTQPIVITFSEIVYVYLCVDIK